MAQDTVILLATGLLILLCLGGVAVVLLGPAFTTQNRVSKRVATVAGTAPSRVSSTARANQEISKDRRKQVQDTLKELEEKTKAKKKRVSLKQLFEQAGLDITLQTFYIASLIAGLSAGAAAFVGGMSPLICLLIAFAAFFGLPRWFLQFMRNSRQKKFEKEFANAIDVIVRGVKSGLPVNECMKIIATEAPSPVCDEFFDLVEGQRIGVSLEQGLERMYERMPLSEVNFFGIVLIIQKNTGGNLAEALTNLSSVLRGRKTLKGKIQAMSSEAKASAMIIGALPFMVMGMLYIMSPDYLMLLFTTKIGNFLLMAGGTWMLMGILVMRNMINMKV